MTEPRFVPTFESVGIYWSPTEGGADNPCRVTYRKAGGQWYDGLDLWYDGRDSPPFLTPEYRGSIVGLEAGTTYHVELSLKSGLIASGSFSTWSEEFPIAQTVQVGDVEGPLEITVSGSPDGYLLYENGTITGGQVNVRVEGSCVILRNLTLVGGDSHAVRIYPPSHDIVIERCDISGWGRVDTNGRGVNWDSGIYVYESGDRDPTDTTVHRIIIQRNRIYHPRADTNSWEEGGHPLGPQGITFISAGSNHVIRYNEIYSDDEHYFNDGIGGSHNKSYTGFPYADSDIYGNIISHCWDDGIEAEGGNRNARIWGNYIDRTYIKIAVASTSVGPLYIWRNICGIAQKDPAVTTDGNGAFLKAGGAETGGVWYGDGRIYVLHNTLLQPLGCSVGIGAWGGRITNLVSRNNILHVEMETDASIYGSADISNSYDYDLYNGQVKSVYGSQETHGIHDSPVYDPSNGAGQFWLDASSPGHDSALILANFNDGFTGNNPDMGAHEAATALMEFGVNAYKTGGQMAELHDGESTTFPDLPSGTYTLTASLPADWGLAAVDTDYPHTDIENGVQFDITAGCLPQFLFRFVKGNAVTVAVATNPAGDPQGFEITLAKL